MEGWELELVCKAQLLSRRVLVRSGVVRSLVGVWEAVSEIMRRANVRGGDIVGGGDGDGLEGRGGRGGS